MIVLEARNVSKKVGSRILIDQISFQVEKGKICGFLGPNGAGKTTMIRLFTGLIRPTSGDLFIHGISVTKHRTQALLHLGAIVESPIFFPYLTGKKALLNLARLHPQLNKRKREAKVEEVLEIVGLSDAKDQKVGTYSLGMKQRLGIAQALLGNPQIIILDEPANGLDPMGMRELRNLILQLRKEQGISFFISSHLLDELQQLCDHLVVIRQGKLVWEGTMTEISGQSVYVYKVSPLSKALKFIQSRYSVQVLSDDQLQVEIGDEEVGTLNKQLIQNGIEVKRVEKNQKRLEEVFLELVKS
jgi:ABC-2 type transport system ATP-binding protein